MIKESSMEHLRAPRARGSNSVGQRGPTATHTRAREVLQSHMQLLPLLSPRCCLQPQHPSSPRLLPARAGSAGRCTHCSPLYLCMPNAVTSAIPLCLSLLLCLFFLSTINTHAPSLPPTPCVHRHLRALSSPPAIFVDKRHRRYWYP